MRDKHILTLLEASQDASHSSLIQSTPAKKREEGCIHPPTEDPLAWECDCYEEMHWRCKKINAVGSNFSTCLRAQFCTHENICPGWASAVCGAKEILEMQSDLMALEHSRSGDWDTWNRPKWANKADWDAIWRTRHPTYTANKKTNKKKGNKKKKKKKSQFMKKITSMQTAMYARSAEKTAEHNAEHTLREKVCH
eukprot:gnl/TRDRNA2_/TRDRNA2_77395_c0_seq1.p1 gnl/TRDRNA2_/TRDRNA2_77395_c0~~gnl/TRDRNA2_/TRDRNA2_77395_c0_seq1.p1  ORF type:complete len:220 (+),score=29.18 gnl/TRDRNA2_/TRDRNA2_77395_c0_seq1:78-662(+)